MTAPNSMTIAANWAGLLYQARHRPDAAPDLAEAARVLHLAIQGRDMDALVTPGGLMLNGTRLPEGAPGVKDLHEQLMAHGVGQLVVPTAATAHDLLALAHALAAYPGAYPDWDAFLQAVGPTRERVRISHTGEDLPLIRYDEGGDHAGPAESDASLQLVDPLAMPDDIGLNLPPLESGYAPIDKPAPVRAAAKSEDARRLEDLVHAGRSADDAGDVVALLGVARDFLDAADAAASEASARVYRLELRRLLAHKHIAQIARLAALGNHKEIAIDVLRRLGSEATEVLMELLVDADSLTERRGYFNALTRMADGTDVIMHHLDHPAWYVVRNAADLCGELRLERAVPRLAHAAMHPDERVRKSVVGALVRIASPGALEPLARLLKDPEAAIRLQVLGNLDGRWGRPLAMSLAALLETEEHPDVVREALRALGRIGTPDAIQALQRVAAGESRRLSKRQRMQAVESLAQAGAPAASILRGLAQDQDREIADSATKALAAATA